MDDSTMWTVLLICYFGLGLVAAGFTMAVFPPHAGYRPPIYLLIAALFAYVLLWPFLAAIGAGYLVGRICNSTPGPRRSPPPRSLRRDRGFVYRALYEETPN
ncbi:MAG: hypothetical protein KDA92_00590 [Planctomycetales bacterium]|nr:hypothetical protein [Planctomycetales bacterium]